jgi:hypothetical protein
MHPCQLFLLALHFDITRINEVLLGHEIPAFNDPLRMQPNGMDLSNIHQNRLNAVARRLNERPRETLNFETPAERFNQCVATTG